MSDSTTSFDFAASHSDPGLPAGTRVVTLAGVRPVEELAEGARIVTRAGACRLRGVRRVAAASYRLVFDAPQIVYLAPDKDGEAKLYRAA